ncbi:hypothetical protein BJV78DRAFT_1181599 [Lactifluus subvellereus]|nr:hypothetical protein BJV78DRAFT_1181599 [Lactifluus subvellereus]
MRTLTPACAALGVLFTLAGVQAFALDHRHDALGNPPVMKIRQVAATTAAAAATTSAAAAATTTSAAAAAPTTTTQQQVATTTTAAPAPASSAQPSTTAAAAPSTTQQQVPASTAQSSAVQSNAPATTQQQPSPTFTFTSAFVTTKQGGQVVTSVVVISEAPSSSASPSQSAAAANAGSSGSSGISSSSIIGLSVAGGVAILGVVGFFVWKFTRKRMNDFGGDEEIKWPELNAHDTGVPLPTNRTGGSGFDTAADVRRSSVYAPSTAANSTAELQPDPYAVPPLPHLDPNQPYRDDPHAAFYDPYRGPIPQSFDQGTPGAPGEAIPMTQFAGRRSPGPGAAYGGDLGGRASPGPRAAYPGGRASPGPQAYGGNYGP